MLITLYLACANEIFRCTELSRFLEWYKQTIRVVG